MLEENQIKILMCMHELEQQLAEMYALFLEKFPEHKTLWTVLIKEELEHADAIQKLYKLTYQKEAAFSEGATRLTAIESILDYVKKTCEIGRQEGLTAEHALELSRDLEKSIIAKNTFNYFKVRLEHANLLKYLRDSSEQHAQQVQEEINRRNKKQFAKRD